MDVEIPNRALFKPAEVCEIANVQPYVLRSWESEFPDLGVSKSSGGPRIYRREDVARVLRIKQLVFTDGLTLAGVRRRIEEEAPPVFEDADVVSIKELLGRNARERLVEVKRGLISILEMLSGRGSHGEPVRESGRSRAAAARPAPRPSRGKTRPRAAKSAPARSSRRRR